MRQIIIDQLRRESIDQLRRESIDQLRRESIDSKVLLTLELLNQCLRGQALALKKIDRLKKVSKQLGFAELKYISVKWAMVLFV